MARMSIDDKILRDPRVIRLARIYGWTRREAVGRLLDVYAIVYDREVDILSASDIDIAAEQEGLADRMVECDLAERRRDKLRIKGAAERIRYLQTREESGRAGGVKSGETRRKKAEQKTKVTFEKIEARANLPDPVPDGVPDPAVLPDSGPSPMPLLPEAERADRKRKLIVAAWNLAGREFRAVQAEGVDPDAVNAWSGLPAADSPPMKNLRAIVDGLLVGERPDYDGALATIERRVRVAAAEARTKHRHAQFMTPARMWNRESFEIASALTPEQIMRAARVGPRASAERAGQERMRPVHVDEEPPT